MLNLIYTFLAFGATCTTAAKIPKDCSCGYTLSQYDNDYYPLSFHVDFSKEPDQKFTSSNGLHKYGFNITDHVGVGGGYMGVQSVGLASNVRIKNGALELIVPGGQTLKGGLTAAEITFGTQYGGMTGGVFTVEAKIDGTPGTCQAIVSVVHTRQISHLTILVYLPRRRG
jgi:hypothetical protein